MNHFNVCTYGWQCMSHVGTGQGPAPQRLPLTGTHVVSLVQLRDLGISEASTGRAPRGSVLHRGYNTKIKTAAENVQNSEQWGSERK